MPENDQDTGVTRWTSREDTILDSLIAFADSNSEGDDTDDTNDANDANDAEDQPTPWQPGHELFFSGYGGQRSLERRAVSVAAKSYVNRVTGNLDMQINREFVQKYDGNSKLTLGVPENAGLNPTIGRLLEDASVVDGADRLHVTGDAEVDINARMHMMTGRVNRLWTGGLTKFCGMEGFICGGVSVVSFVGPCMTIAALGTGDVYGGAARAAVARINIGALTYRSSELAVWGIGFWSRITTFTIVPPVGPEGVGQGKFSNIGKWAAKITFTIMPFGEILWGILQLLLLPFKLLFALLMKIPAMKKFKMAVMARIDSCTAAIKARMSSSDVTV